ncbi:zinc ribbon domain-containing protein [Ktedonobacter racemifer]|uniref:Zinc-ribbon domain-containing protein n=1 Tax=Ktedonobacter racemifer DSM 44963 TaxID=485913 RepID=D6U6T2_KTERA|nr:zinc ribbon domain-containing protein [Ktedonobacter racemifer]EFH80693.1 hypothetical protein Krac_1309 [Ktedonobacter racemifer DSM 44963]
MKPITGQYECQHRSGVGLDYFTSLIDRLILQTNGRFILIVQDRSRLAHMAQSFIKGEQTNATAPAAEIRREGNFYQQGSLLTLRFDDGNQEQGQLTPQEDSIQLGKNLFAKVSDSPSLPSMQRMKKDMDDIAKGIKIATTLGGMAVKAAKTINDTIQSTQKPDPDAQIAGPSQPTANPNYPGQPGQNVASPAPQHQTMPTPPAPPSAPPVVSQNQAPAASGQPIYCEQCGNRCRPGKRFCNRCGAPLF